MIVFRQAHLDGFNVLAKFSFTSSITAIKQRVHQNAKLLVIVLRCVMGPAIKYFPNFLRTELPSPEQTAPLHQKYGLHERPRGLKACVSQYTCYKSSWLTSSEHIVSYCAVFTSSPKHRTLWFEKLTHTPRQCASQRELPRGIFLCVIKIACVFVVNGIILQTWFFRTERFQPCSLMRRFLAATFLLSLTAVKSSRTLSASSLSRHAYSFTSYGSKMRFRL